MNPQLPFKTPDMVSRRALDAMQGQFASERTAAGKPYFQLHELSLRQGVSLTLSSRAGAAQHSRHHLLNRCVPPPCNAPLCTGVKRCKLMQLYAGG